MRQRTKKDTQRPLKQRGFAFVYVIFVSLVISLIIAGSLAAARIEARIAGSSVQQLRRSLAAESAITYAAFILSTEGAGKLGELNGQLFELEGQKILLAVEAEDAKLDINMSSNEVMSAFLNLAGVPHGEAQGLADKIADWRDADDLRRINGAEKADYARIGLNYEPANRPFISINELKQVFGMPPKLVECNKHVLTIYGRHSRPQWRVIEPRIVRSMASTDANTTIAPRPPQVRPGQSTLFLITARDEASNVAIIQRLIRSRGDMAGYDVIKTSLFPDFELPIACEAQIIESNS